MPDIDWGQVIFLILFVVVGFFRWLGNLIQQQKEAKERPTILTPQERALREAAWRKQTGQEAAPVPLPSPTSTAPPPDPRVRVQSQASRRLLPLSSSKQSRRVRSEDVTRATRRSALAVLAHGLVSSLELRTLT